MLSIFKACYDNIKIKLSV